LWQGAFGRGASGHGEDWHGKLGMVCYGMILCGKEINYSHTQSENQNVGASQESNETHTQNA
jgi:hypothetical protein